MGHKESRALLARQLQCPHIIALPFSNSFFLKEFGRPHSAGHYQQAISTDCRGAKNLQHHDERGPLAERLEQVAPRGGHRHAVMDTASFAMFVNNLPPQHFSALSRTLSCCSSCKREGGHPGLAQGHHRGTDYLRAVHRLHPQWSGLRVCFFNQELGKTNLDILPFWDTQKLICGLRLTAGERFTMAK